MRDASAVQRRDAKPSTPSPSPGGGRSDLDFGFFIPFVVVTGFSIIAIIALMWVLAGRVDATSAEREHTLVANALERRTVEIENDAAALASTGAWQTASRERHGQLDTVFVVTPDGERLAAWSRDASRSSDGWGTYAPMFGPLIRKVQEADATTAKLPPAGLVRINRRSLQASQMGMVGDNLYVFTATLAQPGADAAAAAGSPIVLSASGVDLKDLSQRLLLESLTLSPAGKAPPRAKAFVDVRDDAGRTVAAVSWSPARPGHQIYAAAILPVLLVVSSITGIAILTFGRGRRVARGLIESEARATHMALHDALTGLPNRTLFTDRLGRAIEQLKRRRGAVAVLAVDLDRFKEVNDTFGHHFGDELLREVSRRLTETCRTSDTVARIGGDEFAIVQSEATATAAASLARRLNECLAAPIDLSVGKVFIGASIGISLVEEADAEPVEAVRQADLALYRAKDAGRGQYAFFEPGMDAAQRVRRAIEADLRQALAIGGLHMVYQSQVNAKGEVVAVESLVRWNHPERGPINPDFFVPIAEECGLIDVLGVFTLRSAFNDSARWPGHVKVAVNISASQLRLQTFVGTVEALLKETGADARRFELEITEGVFLGEDPKIHETLRRLRELGFTLALDDFGTGYSSLSYLRKYPVDKIKIDGSFIASLGVDKESDAVVGAIIRLAKALNLAVVAEGVETQDQRARLTAAGCGDVQGFLFSRPIPAGEVGGMLSDEAAA